MNTNITNYATINLDENNKMYLVKNGELITQNLPEYGEATVTTRDGKIVHLKTTTSKQV